jgi:hypothetical protein
MSNIAQQIHSSRRRMRFRSSFVFPSFHLIAAAVAGLLVLCAPMARASSIASAGMGWYIDYQQTGDGETLNLANVILTGFFLDTTASDPYTSATVSYPGPGSPQVLMQVSPQMYQAGSFLFPDLATEEAAYPFGTYTFQGVNGPTTDTATLDYPADDYARSNPYLTGADYSALQGMNASRDFTFDLSPFVTGSNASISEMGFVIYDSTGDIVFEPSVSITTTSVVLPANTLSPGGTYYYEYGFYNFDTSSSAGYNAQLGFVIDTGGLFNTAAAPEPGSAGMIVAAGLGGFLILRRRRKIAASAHASGYSCRSARELPSRLARPGRFFGCLKG